MLFALAVSMPGQVTVALMVAVCPTSISVPENFTSNAFGCPGMSCWIVQTN